MRLSSLSRLLPLVAAVAFFASGCDSGGVVSTLQTIPRSTSPTLGASPLPVGSAPDSASGDVPTPLSTGLSLPSSTAGATTASPAPTVSMAMAWGQVPVTTFSTAIGPDRTFNWHHVVTSDGQWFVGTNMPRKFLGTASPSYAVLYNWRTGKLQTMAELATPQSQILEASTDGHWVVWSEADDQGFFNWRIMLYDLSSGRLRELARAAQRDGHAVPEPEAWPVVNHDHVIGSQAIAAMQPGGATIKNAVVRIDDLATGAITTLATAATAPTLSWPWAAWQTGDTAHLWIQATNLSSGQTRRFAGAFAELAISGRTLVYNDPDALTLFIVDDVVSSDPPRILLHSSDIADHLQWPSVTERLIAWSQDTSTRVFDRARDGFVTLPVTGLSASFVSGGLLVWAEPIPGQTTPPATESLEQLDVVEIASLR
jgi:hypothetical protein